MHVRILDLDGSVARQPVLEARATHVLDLRAWGPRLRLACSWPAFTTFECDLARGLLGSRDREPALTFVGSGDFHHLSLALLRRLPRRCNLLVINKHPDWMRHIPFLHCGTWLYHASQLPQVHRVFHVGGEVDFDNHYRWLAPWARLRSGQINVVPATRPWKGGTWDNVPHQPLREQPGDPADERRIRELLDPWREDLARLPLYISLDRDVMTAEHAVVNWDSGHLLPEEVFSVIRAFQDASAGLAGMDVVGDWSPVAVTGWGRTLLHWMEHPHLEVDAELAQECNERLNLELVELVAEGVFV